MKQTFIVLAIFLLTQLIGLHIVSQYIDISASAEEGQTIIRAEQYVIPPATDDAFSFLLILGAVAIGTVLILIIIKYNLVWFWKMWFILASILAISIALNPYVTQVFSNYAFLISIVIASVLIILKLRSFSIITYNATEILMYGGIAALFVPMLTLPTIAIILVIMSAYDIYAVQKSKHMISMAKFQTKTKLFAGILTGKPTEKKTGKHAMMLGGGDIAFPLFFAGVVLKTSGSVLAAGLVALCAAGGLFILLRQAEKGTFYPALPAVSSGAVFGYIIYLLQIQFF